MKSIDEVDLMDDVFMNLVASDPDVGEDFCRTLLSVLLQCKIGKVKVHVQRVLPGSDIKLRGVRLDVEVEERNAENMDIVANVYDIEPHNKKELDFAKMLRFRQAKIDGRYMKAGDNDYAHLPNLYVILISEFDVWGEDYMMYTVHNTCDEIPALKYNDGLTFLYFNAKGTKGGSDSIRNMLKYMQDSKKQSAVDEATRKLDEYVSNVRQDPEIRGDYMTFGDRIDWEKEQSREEGREEGRREGREEGQTLLAEAIRKLREGKTVDELVESGVDKATAELAWSCK
ncbi:MAG: hypothetical protein K5871_06420 [Lachnospiraceae bacterium]|nr:hypothetical protein [Lachnospiraceae bacterium]